MLNHYLQKMKRTLGEKVGASNVEIIVWISVCLVIATALFLFRDAIQTFITSATSRVSAFLSN